MPPEFASTLPLTVRPDTVPPPAARTSALLLPLKWLRETDEARLVGAKNSTPLPDPGPGALLFWIRLCCTVTAESPTATPAVLFRMTLSSMTIPVLPVV
jgi:hypothetical protein